MSSDNTMPCVWLLSKRNLITVCSSYFFKLYNTTTLRKNKSVVYCFLCLVFLHENVILPFEKELAILKSNIVFKITYLNFSLNSLTVQLF